LEVFVFHFECAIVPGVDIVNALLVYVEANYRVMLCELDCKWKPDIAEADH
jgi:hypothetical protein